MLSVVERLKRGYILWYEGKRSEVIVKGIVEISNVDQRSDRKSGDDSDSWFWPHVQNLKTISSWYEDYGQNPYILTY